jgi:hypothetical protein
MPDLRPGKPRHRGECPLPGTNRPNGVELMRETVAALTVYEPEAQSETRLEPGTLLGECRIHRSMETEIAQGAEPYVVRFQWAAREYRCPLYRFQARTRVVEPAPVAKVDSLRKVAV